MKTLIVIGGPTASGKTAIAIQTARYFNTRILSADSRQCYREMNIGVAKPEPEQLAQVEHYFINSHSIHDEVTAGTFERYGLNCLSEIFADHDFAVCTGGTGLYIKALCEGLDEMPKIDPLIEKELDTAFRVHGLNWLQQETAQHDPDFFAKAEQNNPQRLLRALSFIRSTGKSILQYRKRSKKERDFAVRYFALEHERSVLYQRIDQRVDEMMSRGLLQEVESLIPYRALNPLQTVGYTELFSFFDGKISLEQAINKIKQHTRNYAKRQITWCRHQGSYTFVTADYENIIQSLGTSSD